MKKHIFAFFLIVFLTASACGLPIQTKWSSTPAKTPAAAGDAMTPAAATQVAEVIGDVPVQPTSAVKQRAMPQGVTNIMVLGSDYRPGMGYRTDVIMLVSVNTVKQTVSVVSFPRDLYVPIPGWTTQRINTAQPHGGFPMLAATMETNFGVRPDYYVMTNFEGFKGIVDSMGGVTIYAGSTLSDKCDLPIAENGTCTIQPGLHDFDGATALWYIRSRHTSSDLDRTRREQEVMSGIFSKLMSGGAVANLPNLYARYKSSVETNLTVQAMTPMLPTAAKVFADRKLIHRYSLTVKEAKPFVTNTGAQVLLPDYNAINAILDEAIFTP